MRALGCAKDDVTEDDRSCSIRLDTCRPTGAAAFLQLHAADDEVARLRNAIVADYGSFRSGKDEVGRCGQIARRSLDDDGPAAHPRLSNVDDGHAAGGREGLNP